VRRAQNRCRGLGERDENRVTGRMRLVRRHVEVNNSECEVNRVDIFERRRQEQEMRRQEDHRERRNGFSQKREIRPLANGAPRSSCRDDILADPR
jgi:hypothetical protein